MLFSMTVLVGLIASYAYITPLRVWAQYPPVSVTAVRIDVAMAVSPARFLADWELCRYNTEAGQRARGDRCVRPAPEPVQDTQRKLEVLKQMLSGPAPHVFDTYRAIVDVVEVWEWEEMASLHQAWVDAAAVATAKSDAVPQGVKAAPATPASALDYLKMPPPAKPALSQQQRDKVAKLREEALAAREIKRARLASPPDENETSAEPAH